MAHRRFPGDAQQHPRGDRSRPSRPAQRDLRVQRRAAPPRPGHDRLRRPLGCPLQGQRLPQHDHLRRPRSAQRPGRLRHRHHRLSDHLRRPLSGRSCRRRLGHGRRDGGVRGRAARAPPRRVPAALRGAAARRRGDRPARGGVAELHRARAVADGGQPGGVRDGAQPAGPGHGGGPCRCHRDVSVGHPLAHRAVISAAAAAPRGEARRAVDRPRGGTGGRAATGRGDGLGTRLDRRPGQVGGRRGRSSRRAVLQADHAGGRRASPRLRSGSSPTRRPPSCAGRRIACAAPWCWAARTCRSRVGTSRCPPSGPAPRCGASEEQL